MFKAFYYRELNSNVITNILMMVLKVFLSETRTENLKVAEEFRRYHLQFSSSLQSLFRLSNEEGRNFQSRRKQSLRPWAES